MAAKKKSKRGLAAMSLEKRRAIASMGGKSVPKEKRAFSDKALAKAAGKRGGNRSAQREAKAKGAV